MKKIHNKFLDDEIKEPKFLKLDKKDYLEKQRYKREIR